MKYRYVRIYNIRGLTHPPGKGDIEIYVSKGVPSINAILTDKIDDYSYELDRSHVVGYLMLKGLVGNRGSSDLNDEIANEIKRLHERRNKEGQDSESLVFIAEGDIDVDFSRPNSETHDYIIGFDLINKEQIIDTHSSQVNAALVALSLTTEDETIQVKLIQWGVYLINETAKPVYSFEISGSAEVYTSRRTSDKFITEATDHLIKLMGDPSLSQTYRLYVQSISSDKDELRRFMFGWAGLEMLINKVFSNYEKKFIQNLLGAEPAHHTQKYFERIRDVMKGKYRLGDKFVVMAACIGSGSVDIDIQNFNKIKETRDALMHGDILDEKSLPISETVALLKKYLRQHINAI